MSDKYQRHSSTSRKAAAEIASGASTLRNQVLDFLRELGDYGATDEEIQLALDMNPSTQRPRRVELVERRLVKNSGKTRLTTSKRSAVVWVYNEREFRQDTWDDVIENAMRRA